jgi:DNA-binding MarR family transcriptional regulator
MKPVAKRTRQELLNRVGLELGREISAQTVFFHESVAHKLGLNATDTRSLNLLSRGGRSELSAGELGKATGLTTGAVTGIIDRLESAGLVERIRDSTDRRRIFVRVKPEAAARLAHYYENLGAAMMKLACSYETEELKLIRDFLERSLAVLQKQISTMP